jgi:hypothetical protein
MAEPTRRTWDKMAEQPRPGFGFAPFVWNYWRQIVEEQGIPR